MTWRPCIASIPARPAGCATGSDDWVGERDMLDERSPILMAATDQDSRCSSLPAARIASPRSRTARGWSAHCVMPARRSRRFTSRARGTGSTPMRTGASTTPACWISCRGIWVVQRSRPALPYKPAKAARENKTGRTRSHEGVRQSVASQARSQTQRGDAAASHTHPGEAEIRNSCAAFCVVRSAGPAFSVPASPTAILHRKDMT